jgi:hypothetical protein
MRTWRNAGGSHLINEKPHREYFYLRATLANCAIIMISASNCFSGCVS